MLVPMGDILESAKAKGYAVVAPNVINEDTARVCIEAAVEKRSPMILDFAPFRLTSSALISRHQ